VPRKSLTLINKLGLHARAAMKLVNLASKYQSQITIKYQQNTIDAKSILNVMALGISCGKTIGIITEGEDENEALQAIEDLINDRFGESE
jgi:phosphocarrier protein HPr